MIFDDDFEWDEPKNLSNQEDHGYSFEEARIVWDGPTYTFQDRRPYKETRYVSIGYLDSATILFVVYTWRGPRKRIISAREATEHEKQRFQDYRRSRKGRGSR